MDILSKNLDSEDLKNEPDSCSTEGESKKDSVELKNEPDSCKAEGESKINSEVLKNEPDSCFIVDAEGESRKDLEDLKNGSDSCFVVDAEVDDDKMAIEFNIEVDPDTTQNSEIVNNGTAENEECQGLADVSYEVPVYDTKFTGFLDSKEYSIETGKHIPNDAQPKKMCFNCLGDHNINECELKKNFKDIARNRQNILGRKTSNVRYHEEGQNKYGNFVPGQLSESLRYALGLGENDAPEHIYRMRVLGYPPGWLKDAEVNRSDVCLFDGNGKELCHPEDEEGEADVKTIKYEPDKLITFPGFNAPFPRHIKDDHRYYNCPRMQRHHRKEEFERLMNLNRVQKYKRKKLKVSDTPQSTPSEIIQGNILVATSEMEIDNSELASNSNIEFNPPLPTVEMPPLPVDGSPISNPSTDVKDKEEGELSENPSDVIQSSNDLSDPNENGANILMTSISSDRLSPQSAGANGNVIENSSEAPVQTTPVTSHGEKKTKRHHRSLSKGFDFGVAIPESITPYKSLPSSEKWSVDVSDHLPFENLPDALGTWGKMKGLVQTVRKFVDALNADNDDEL